MVPHEITTNLNFKILSNYKINYETNTYENENDE